MKRRLPIPCGLALLLGSNVAWADQSSPAEPPAAEELDATPGDLARAVCVGALTLGASLGCVAATSACTGTTVVTIGGTAYPCLLVLGAACGAIPASSAVYIYLYCSR